MFFSGMNISTDNIYHFVHIDNPWQESLAV